MEHLGSKILCAVDFSAASRAALDCAVELAAADKGLVHLVHVYEAPVTYAGELDPTYFAASNEEAHRDLERWKQELEAGGRVRVQATHLVGAPWDRIVTFAGEGHHDCIVLGTQGRGAITRALLGSVAERVVRHAPCSVLVVRPLSART